MIINSVIIRLWPVHPGRRQRPRRNTKHTARTLRTRFLQGARRARRVDLLGCTALWQTAGRVTVWAVDASAGGLRSTPAWMYRCSATLVIHRIRRIHRRQHAFTDDTGMSKHRLSPYNAYYHNWQTLNFTDSDSGSDDRCFLKVLIVLHLMQLAGSKFQLSITLLENAYFLTFSLNLFLNSFWSCPLLSP